MAQLGQTFSSKNWKPHFSSISQKLKIVFDFSPKNIVWLVLTDDLSVGYAFSGHTCWLDRAGIAKNPLKDVFINVFLQQNFTMKLFFGGDKRNVLRSTKQCRCVVVQMGIFWQPESVFGFVYFARYLNWWLEVTEETGKTVAKALHGQRFPLP